ncbi:hypothetical protein D5F01_LYC19804 [Larimichthys crocea]|uniref:Uncharacterized protein n=1 Tax=Larimichthys crocea TaxID=215358 RepID=A0A6G0HT04_LARCR|nr:hypothetical protein D5F01_LYC19804 [Larimichthys crocea]
MPTAGLKEEKGILLLLWERTGDRLALSRSRCSLTCVKLQPWFGSTTRTCSSSSSRSSSCFGYRTVLKDRSYWCLYPAEDDLQSILKMEGVADEAQTILVSEVDLKRRMAENSGGGTVCDGDQQPVMNAASVEMREDVREKLKEHLEGFHLQLSTEFLN